MSTPVSSSQWKSHFDTSHWSTPWCVTTPCPLVHPPCPPDHPLSLPVHPPRPPQFHPSRFPVHHPCPLIHPSHPQSTPLVLQSTPSRPPVHPLAPPHIKLLPLPSEFSARQLEVVCVERSSWTAGGTERSSDHGGTGCGNGSHSSSSGKHKGRGSKLGCTSS